MVYISIQIAISTIITYVKNFIYNNYYLYTFFNFYLIVKGYLFYIENINVLNMDINNTYGIFFKGNLSINSNIIENNGYSLFILKPTLFFRCYFI